MMGSGFVLITLLLLNVTWTTGYCTFGDNRERSRLNLAPTQASIESTSTALANIAAVYGLSSDAIIFPDQKLFANIVESSTSVTLLPNILDNNQNKPKTRSARECDAYAQEIKDIIDAASTTTTLPKSVEMKTNATEDDEGTVHITVVGGEDAEENEFAHMVALGRRASDGTFVLMCGATLISHNWALTAAHCTYGPNGSPTDTRLGMNKLTDQRSGISIRIQKMIRHPDYAPPTIYADIALVKLASSVIFGTSIKPACLYQYNETDSIQAASVTGWGVTEYAGDPSDILQKASLFLIDNPTCATQHGTSREIPRGIMQSMICAGDLYNDWKKDSCQGDSGGPLQVQHGKHQQLYEVIGITSFGLGCANESPGVYTRVSHYLSWIEDIVWPQ